ncbi:Early nodulin-55-2, partial [Mucuna pruriens]
MALCLPNASPLFLVMFSMCFLISFSEAKEYVVGGTENSWKAPLSSPDSFNHWANTHRFKIVFKYDERTESVHVVNETDYERCNTVGQQHVVFNDGNTKVLLTKSGLKHFISGKKSHCQMGLKLSVVVFSNNKTKNKNNFESPSPSPSSTPTPSPSPTPTQSLPSPSPLPNNEGVTRSSGGVTMLLLVSLAMMLFV